MYIYIYKYTCIQYSATHLLYFTCKRTPLCCHDDLPLKINSFGFRLYLFLFLVQIIHTNYSVANYEKYFLNNILFAYNRTC